MHGVAFWVVASCWAAVGAAFLVRRRPPRVREVRRDPGWKVGLLFQGAAILLLFWLRRPWAAPSLGLGERLEATLAVVAVALAAGCAWILWAAERALGRQFAYQARLVEGHQLVTTGPYRYVRHPMYAAVLGLGLATAITWSRWEAVPPFLVLYVAGTFIRVRVEEKLLREAFGAEFEAYARRVPALLPRLGRRERSATSRAARHGS